MKTLSYAITACNEHVELERLLDQLQTSVRPEDEIMLQLDTTATEEVKKVAEKYNIFCKCEYHRIYASLNNDFASFKNNLKNHCTRDYVFFIDADEYLSDTLLHTIAEVIEFNPRIDIYALPRINTVEGLTQEDIQKWGWSVNDKGWVNYPDPQTRICRNIPTIQWVGKVHERLTGPPITTAVAQLPEEFDLLHPKTITRQRLQNSYYSTL